MNEGGQAVGGGIPTSVDAAPKAPLLPEIVVEEV
jgi:hypothetical protein